MVTVTVPFQCYVVWHHHQQRSCAREMYTRISNIFCAFTVFLRGLFIQTFLADIKPLKENTKDRFFSRLALT